MIQTGGGPVDARARLSQLDVIHGFALFGVLQMNLYEHADYAIPADRIVRLAPAAVEGTVEFASAWLMPGRVQALFSQARTVATDRNGPDEAERPIWSA